MDDSPETIVSNLWIFSDLLLQGMGVFAEEKEITLIWIATSRRVWTYDSDRNR